MRIKLDTSDDITRENTHVMMVFETDIMWGGANAAMYGGNLAFLRFYYDNSSSYAEAYTMPITADGKLTIKSHNGTSVATLDEDKWYNVRIEIIDNKSSLYLNGELISSASPFSSSNDMKITHVQFEPRAGTSIMSGLANENNVFDISFDNTFAARVAAANSRGYGKYANDETYASMVETYQNFTANTTATNSTATSNPNITAVHWTWTDKWTKLLSDIEGKYFEIGRNGSSAFGARPTFTVDKTEDVTDKTYKTVFETDVLWGEHNEALNGKTLSYIRLVVGGADTALIHVNVDSEGKLYFGSNGAAHAIAVGEWANLRIEIAKNTISVYVNGELAHTASSSAAMNTDSVQFEIRQATSINSTAPAEAGVFSLSLDNTFCVRVEDK